METRPVRLPRYLLAFVFAGVAVIGLVLVAGLAVLGGVGRAEAQAAGAAPTVTAAPTRARPTATPRPTAPALAAAGEGWGSQVPLVTGSSEINYRAWMIALLTYDTPTALALYMPAGGGDPTAEVEGYIAQLRALFPGPGDREGPMGAWRDVREAGEYADPADAGVRYAVTQIFFERGEACLQGTLVEHGDGWYVQGWGQLTDAECEEALARIAEGRR
jgi:hypothetical protein